MTTCPNCNKEIADGTKFCEDCGTQIPETVFCPTCEKQTAAGADFCEECAAAMNQPAAEQPEQTPKKTKKFPKKALLFTGIGIIAVAVLVFIISAISGEKKMPKNNYALYVKDQEIYFSDLKKSHEPLEVTSKLFDSNIDNESIVGEAYDLLHEVVLSDDGKYLFFPDKINDDENGFNLYFRDVTKPKKDAIKIASDVRGYIVNDSATLVTYMNTDSDLYQYNIKKDDKEKIAGNVSELRISEDAKTVIYINDDSNLYLKKTGKDKEKLTGDVSNIEAASKNLDVIYYTKDETLYRQEGTKDKVKVASDVSYVEAYEEDTDTIYFVKEETLYKKQGNKDNVKIASDVSSVLHIYDSGELYYTKYDKEEISCMDYVIDDKKSQDDNMTEPDYPDYYDYYSYSDYSIDWDAYDKALDEYWDAYYEYSDKEDRDELREELKSEKMEIYTYSLCYYDGKKETVITDAFNEDSYEYWDDCAIDAPVIAYSTIKKEDADKIKLSEIDSIYDVEWMIEDALDSSSASGYYVAVKGKATELKTKSEVPYISVNSSGTTVYYLDDVDEDDAHGDLYTVSVSGSKVGKAKLYDKDVYCYYNWFVNEDDLMYFKDVDAWVGELYINKNKVSSDVETDSVTFGYFDTDDVYYYTDVDDEEGTLNVYNGKKSKEVSEDVYDFTVTPDGRVLYLVDYNTEKHKGELYEWNGRKSRKIDEDVIVLFDIPHYYE